MRYYSSLEEIPSDFGPSAVTFGKFDGVHVGHRQVISELRSAALEQKLRSTVLTFDRNPLALLDPPRCPESISSNTQKRELFASTGIDAMVQLPFDRAFSGLLAENFVERILAQALDARLVLVGPDTRFGAGGAGNFELLEQLGSEKGIEVRKFELVTQNGDEPVSSTRIRHLLADGRVAEAGRMLGRAPTVRSIVVMGQQRGRELGYPTANLSPQLEGFIPADGVYAGFLTADGRRMPAAISIGNNPTFDGVPEKQVEGYVLDEDLDLYDKTVEIEFVDRIRGMEKFASLKTLIAKMDDDVVRVRTALNGITTAPE